MKLDITKRIELSQFVDASVKEQWKECYLEFAIPSYKDIKELPTEVDQSQMEKGIERVVKVLQNLFRDGKALSEGSIKVVKADDIPDFPITVLTECIQVISGKVDPN